jgi:hypothetical protein
VADRPILFNDEMVRRILAGAKTQTRRPVKLADPEYQAVRGLPPWPHGSHPAWPGEWGRLDCPFGVSGDRLWVRECFALSVRDPEDTDRDTMDPIFWDPPVYRATYEPGGGWTRDGEAIAPPWRPSIHMPRWASRLTLRVTDVRVERVQNITNRDAIAEGIPPNPSDDEREMFRALWSETYGEFIGLHAWGENPWVWVVSFERMQGVPS